MSQQKPHSLSEIFRRADEMNWHPLNWPWDHWYIQSGYSQRLRWLLYNLGWKRWRIFQPWIIRQIRRVAFIRNMMNNARKKKGLTAKAEKAKRFP